VRASLIPLTELITKSTVSYCEGLLYIGNVVILMVFAECAESLSPNMTLSDMSASFLVRTSRSHIGRWHILHFYWTVRPLLGLYSKLLLERFPFSMYFIAS
jgi:hypothetical protein